MPTGYTQDIYSGKHVTFREYALGCARAFGAFVTMRDNPVDVPLPEAFEPSTYARDALEEARRHRDAVKAMSPADCDEAAAAEHRSELARWERDEAENERRKSAYRAMLEEAHAYEPPTSEHERFAAFLVEQLETSLQFDCHEAGDPHYERPEPKTGTEWRKAQLDSAVRSIAYYTKEWANEQERTASRNTWIAALYDSLPEAANV